jgi:hypothetical protein
MRRCCFQTIMLAVSMAISARAQQFSQQGPKLVGSGAVYFETWNNPVSGGNGVAQGDSVAVSGDGNTALIGGYGDNGGVGAVWVFTRDSNGNWSQQGNKLVVTDAGSYPQLGYSVAVSGDGNTALIAGSAVWVFTRDSSGSWSQQGDKLASSGALALSADGSTALVGIPPEGVAVFTRDSNGNWRQQGNKLVGSGAIGYAGQGSALALSADGNTGLVGAANDNNGLGAVWVFTRDSNGNWSQQGNKLVGSGAVGTEDGVFQGSSVALSADGNTALVGGPGDDSGTNADCSSLGYPVCAKGAVWVFTRDSSGNWSQQGNKLVGSGAADIASSGGFGQGLSVALSADGNTALVGGTNDNNDLGAVWVFTRDSNGNWSQQGNKLVGSGAVTSGPVVSQGSSVALSADGLTALVGAKGDSDWLGAVWVFVRASSAVPVQSP